MKTRRLLTIAFVLSVAAATVSSADETRWQGVQMRGGRPGLPFKALATWMGATQYQRSDSGEITMLLGGRETKVRVDDRTAVVRGRTVELRAPLFEVDGVVYLPVSTVRTLFWADARWISDKGQASVVHPRTHEQLVLTDKGRHQADLVSQYKSLYDAANLDELQRALKAEPGRVTARVGEWEEEYGFTLLHLAARHGHLEVAELLLKLGADVNDCQISAEENVEPKDQEQALTPLHLAARHNHPAMVKLLLANGADVNAVTHYAVPRGKKAKNIHNGVTALKLAAQCGFVDVVQLLLKDKADPNLAVQGGAPADYPPVQMSALSWAARYNDVAISRMLLEHGARTEPRDWLGGTALSWAARYGNDESVTLLLAHKADVNAEDRAGLTPRRWAMRNGFPKTAELLAKHGGLAKTPPAAKAVVFVTNPLDVCDPSTQPTKEQLSDTVAAFGSRGEYEPLTFSVRAIKDLKAVNVEVGELKSKSAVIPPSQIDLRMVSTFNRWLRADNPVKTEYFLDRFEAVDIATDKTQRFWLTVHVPYDAPPGIYKAPIMIREGDQLLRTLTMQFEVLAIDLSPPDGMNYFQYSNPAALARNRQTPEYNEKILRDMKAHGMTTFTAGGWLQSVNEIDGPHAQRLGVNVEGAMKTGLIPPGGTAVWCYGLQYVNEKLLEEILFEARKRKWPRLSLYLVDEPGGERVNKVLERMRTIAALRRKHPELPFRTITTTTLDSDFRNGTINGGVGHFYDILVAHAPNVTPTLVEEARRLGKQVWTYQCQVAPGPGHHAAFNRYYFGYWAWKSGISGCSFYMYCSRAYTSRNSNTGTGPKLTQRAWWEIPEEHRDQYIPRFALVRLDPEGPVPSLGWEAVREGVDDYRYLITLKKAIAKARKDGRTKAADQAQRAILEVEDRIDLSSQKRSTDAAMKRYHKQGAMALWYRPPPQDDISTTDYNSFRRRIANQIVQLTGDRKAN